MARESFGKVETFCQRCSEVLHRYERKIENSPDKKVDCTIEDVLYEVLNESGNDGTSSSASPTPSKPLNAVYTFVSAPGPRRGFTGAGDLGEDLQAPRGSHAKVTDTHWSFLLGKRRHLVGQAGSDDEEGGEGEEYDGNADADADVDMEEETKADAGAAAAPKPSPDRKKAEARAVQARNSEVIESLAVLRVLVGALEVSDKKPGAAASFPTLTTLGHLLLGWGGCNRKCRRRAL